MISGLSDASSPEIALLSTAALVIATGATILMVTERGYADAVKKDVELAPLLCNSFPCTTFATSFQDCWFHTITLSGERRSAYEG